MPHQAGVLHLRKIAVFIMHLYVDEQPQCLEAVVPLVDSSIDWFDARQLIVYGMSEYYLKNFEREYGNLLGFAHDERARRVLIPLETGKSTLEHSPAYTAMALTFIPAAMHSCADEGVRRSMHLLLRSAAISGDQLGFAHYITAFAEQDDVSCLRSVCEAILNPSIRWSPQFRDSVLPFLRNLKTRDGLHRDNLLTGVIQRLESPPAH